MRRMDRYKDASPEENISRAQMNKELYENIGNNTRYTDIADVTTSNEIDLSSRRNSRTREGYHQMKEYQDVVPIPRVKKELEEFKNIYKDKENKIYDINTILEEARKNRHEKDSKEEKRKLKNDTYNILANLNNDELEKLRQERKDRLRKSVSEEDDLFENADNEEIVDDLAAASELLGDLMATNVLKKISIEKETDDDDDLKLEKTISEEDLDTSDKEDDEEQENEEKEEHEDEIDIDEVSTEDSDEDESEDKDEEDESDDDDDDKTFIDEDKLTLSREIEDLKLLKKLDNLPKENPDETDETEEDESDDDDEMYTKTMDLSEMDLEIDEEFKEKKLPFGLKILIVLIILVILACVYLFFWETI